MKVCASNGQLIGTVALLAVVLSASAVPLPSQEFIAESDEVTGILTSQDGKRWGDIPSLQWSSTAPSDASIITVSLNQTYQTILGFGGAFTESSAYVLSELSNSTRASVLNMMFGKEGLKYTAGRLPIGSCDYSLETYSYDDHKGDTDLKHFSIQKDIDNGMLPLVQEASKIAGKPINIVASPWSAPGWMKDNGHAVCGPSAYLTLCKLKNSMQGPWAKYLSKYLHAVKDYGLNVWGMTIQNEPEGMVLHEAMWQTASWQRDFLKGHLGPLMRKEHPDVKVLIYDHNEDHIVKWADTILGDEEAAKYADGTAYHWYSGDHPENMETVHEKYPDKLLLATESTAAFDKEDVEGGEWSIGEHYGRAIAGDLASWSLGFLDWNLILDQHGGPLHYGKLRLDDNVAGSDSMLIANISKETKDPDVIPQVSYYYMGHFSRFLDQGDVRVGVSAPQELQYSTAFRTTSGNVVVIVQNQNDEPKVAAVKYNGKFVNINLPAHSIATVQWKA